MRITLEQFIVYYTAYFIFAFIHTKLPKQVSFFMRPRLFVHKIVNVTRIISVIFWILIILTLIPKRVDILFTLYLHDVIYYTVAFMDTPYKNKFKDLVILFLIGFLIVQSQVNWMICIIYLLYTILTLKD